MSKGNLIICDSILKFQSPISIILISIYKNFIRWINVKFIYKTIDWTTSFISCMLLYLFHPTPLVFFFLCLFVFLLSSSLYLFVLVPFFVLHPLLLFLAFLNPLFHTISFSFHHRTYKSKHSYDYACHISKKHLCPLCNEWNHILSQNFPLIRFNDYIILFIMQFLFNLIRKISYSF